MSESSDQAALFDFLARMEGRYPALAFVKHTPNGEKRDIVTATRLKRMGVRAGVWDVEFLYPNQADIAGRVPGHYRGLAVELKVGKNDLTPDQRRWREHYDYNHWATCVCHTWTDAARLLLTWVGGNPDEVEGL